MVHKQFYTLEVASVRKTTEDCTVVSFKIDDSLRELFQYHCGQHLTLKTTINGEEVRRSYSLCSSPLDNKWEVAVKKIDGGLFSTYVNEQLKSGDRLEVMPPSGRFFIESDASQAKNYAAFAAGSGITPVISIIKTHLIQEPGATFKLFYVNRHVGSIILKEEIEALKNHFLERFEVFYFLTQEERDVPLLNGRLTEEKLDTLFNRVVDREVISDYFLCGPEAMIFMIRNYLTDINVPEKNIHFELFTSESGAQKVKKAIMTIANGHENCEVTILEGGKSFKFSLPQGSNTILDSALQKSADLPFACKGGVCCTCRAKLLEGKVDMAVHYGLEQDEIDNGYILTCQSIPLSEKVVVDFDH